MDQTNSSNRPLFNVNSLIIEGDSKIGKMTFLLYLLAFYYRQKALIFSAQDPYLFRRKISVLKEKYPQFSDLEKLIDPYFLAEDWTDMKRKYGYDFLLREILRIVRESDEKIIVFHRIGDFFEFQDRHEIERIYKALIKKITEMGKRVIFVLSRQSEFFEQIQHIAEEYTDITVIITKDEKNRRLVDIRDALHNREYPTMLFKIHLNQFILEELKTDNESQRLDRHVLIVELNEAHENMIDITKYILEAGSFAIHYADSLESILKEIFIEPALIVVYMKRNEENFETTKAIKQMLPDVQIVAILDQPFVRSEDAREAYLRGCAELFANNFNLDDYIRTLEKLLGEPFYNRLLEQLPLEKKVMEKKEDLKALAIEAKKKHIYFTLIVLSSQTPFEGNLKGSRKYDYLYIEKNELYFLAVNTLPRHTFPIIEKFRKYNPDTHLICMWEPINIVEACF